MGASTSPFLQDRGAGGGSRPPPPAAAAEIAAVNGIAACLSPASPLPQSGLPRRPPHCCGFAPPTASLSWATRRAAGDALGLLPMPLPLNPRRLSVRNSHPDRTTPYKTHDKVLTHRGF
jgi:hypothetical protein